jgi:hypothetical protein
MSETRQWKVCSICRKPIEFGQRYYACSVSTCRRPRTQLFFCSLNCFGAHVPMERHRDAWAEEEKAPTREQATAAESATAENAELGTADDHERAGGTAAAAEAPRRRVAGGSAPEPAEEGPTEILIVASKLKQYVRAHSGMNTSDGVFAVLSDHLRELSVAALRVAAADGRKTVMDRDYHVVLKRWRPAP